MRVRGLLRGAALSPSPARPGDLLAGLGHTLAGSSPGTVATGCWLVLGTSTQSKDDVVPSSSARPRLTLARPRGAADPRVA